MIGVLLATCVICLVLSGLAAITDWWQDSWQRDVDRARRFRAALAPDDRRRRRFTLSCPVCGECHTAHQHRESVDAFVGGPEGCGRVTLGSIWATDR